MSEADLPLPEFLGELEQLLAGLAEVTDALLAVERGPPPAADAGLAARTRHVGEVVRRYREGVRRLAELIREHAAPPRAG